MEFLKKMFLIADLTSLFVLQYWKPQQVYEHTCTQMNAHAYNKHTHTHIFLFSLASLLQCQKPSLTIFYTLHTHIDTQASLLLQHLFSFQSIRNLSMFIHIHICTFRHVHMYTPLFPTTYKAHIILCSICYTERHHKIFSRALVMLSADPTLILGITQIMPPSHPTSNNSNQEESYSRNPGVRPEHHWCGPKSLPAKYLSHLRWLLLYHRGKNQS